MRKRKFEIEQMITDIRDHPVKAYFKYPVGPGIDFIRPSELVDGFAECVVSVWNLFQIIVLLIWQWGVLLGLLRPVYKAYCLCKSRKHILRRMKKFDRK